jgi:hypothetical protein
VHYTEYVKGNSIGGSGIAQDGPRIDLDSGGGMIRLGAGADATGEEFDPLALNRVWIA